MVSSVLASGMRQQADCSSRGLLLINVDWPSLFGIAPDSTGIDNLYIIVRNMSLIEQADAAHVSLLVSCTGH